MVMVAESTTTPAHPTAASALHSLARSWRAAGAQSDIAIARAAPMNSAWALVAVL
jgi:hypothetical protein